MHLRAIYHRLIQSISEDGYKSTCMRLRRKLHSKFGAKAFKKSWKLNEADRKQQEKRAFNSDALISILVPLYNTPVIFLNELLDSVQAQTCKRYELCLADGSDEVHAEVGEIVKNRALSDNRIRYLKLDKNGGISENTNACIRMATGSYFALLDHDDLLHPSALFYVMQAIEETKADFIYTDEATFRNHPKDAYLPHFKQDFSPDTLRAHNYICHLTVFSRELTEKAGGFRKEYDGSQDYDMVLRLTEKAEKIVHIPRILTIGAITRPLWHRTCLPNPM
jgi:glycosyltransferase involved in cell wall biosynthesis